MKIIQSSYEQIKHLRTVYLDSLAEFQELYVELMIYDSDFYLIKVNNTEIGYAIKTNDRILIEFYVIDSYVSHSLIYFNQIIAELSIIDIYCKSFDYLLLSNCLFNSYSYELLGALYRDYCKKEILKDPALVMKQADQTSAMLIMSQDESIQELFETETQLRDFIKTDRVFIFSIGKSFVGCGSILKTIKGWNCCDLGVWVHPNYRKLGIGSQIILNLREFALEKGMKPTCGCAIDNIASQSTIEKSGYISKHKLINFKTVHNK